MAIVTPQSWQSCTIVVKLLNGKVAEYGKMINFAGEERTDMENMRKLPAGLQSFKLIREEGYLYVDKTGIIWNLVNNGSKYNYLSRLVPLY